MRTMLKAIQFGVRETIWILVLAWFWSAYVLERAALWMERQITKRVLGD